MFWVMLGMYVIMLEFCVGVVKLCVMGVVFGVGVVVGVVGVVGVKFGMGVGGSCLNDGVGSSGGVGGFGVFLMIGLGVGMCVFSMSDEVILLCYFWKCFELLNRGLKYLMMMVVVRLKMMLWSRLWLNLSGVLFVVDISCRFCDCMLIELVFVCMSV